MSNYLQRINSFKKGVGEHREAGKRLETREI